MVAIIETRWTERLAPVAVVAFLLIAAQAAAQPHALVPLNPPHFTIDRVSPTLSGAIQSDDVLAKPGPAVVINGPNLNLGRANDYLDGISYNRSEISTGQTVVLLFSVSRNSVGAIGPDPGLAATGRIFNVQDQAARHQAPADLYMALDGFTRFGPLFFGEGRAPTFKNNTLGVNQGDSGGVDFDLQPLAAPIETIPLADPLDEVGGMAYPPGTTPALRVAVGPFFFSLAPGSTSLTFLPGSQGPADIYIDNNPNAPGGEALYAQPTQIGLQPGPAGDDIDALIVFDNGNGVFQSGIDQVIFSLAPGSPSLGPNSPADVFFSQGFGFFNLYVRAIDLGLLHSDNLDALEMYPTNNVNSFVFDHAIFKIIPGDYDHNDLLDTLDRDAFLNCYSGSGSSYDLDGSALVLVNVGPGNFNPANVTIEAGDSVRWTWQGGTHNVVSGSGGTHDGRFNSGPPNGTIGATFTVAFDAAFLNLHPAGQWLYPYYCEPHFPFMIGSVRVVADPCATFDFNEDGDVDCADWFRFEDLYAQLNGGIGPILLTIPQFVDVLVGYPQHPSHPCMADRNRNGRADGDDIARYTLQALMP